MGTKTKFIVITFIAFAAAYVFVPDFRFQVTRYIIGTFGSYPAPQ